jgi:hypothetical protein
VVLAAHCQFGKFAAAQAQDRGRQRRGAGVSAENELEGRAVVGRAGDLARRRRWLARDQSGDLADLRWAGDRDRRGRFPAVGVSP